MTCQILHHTKTDLLLLEFEHSVIDDDPINQQSIFSKLMEKNTSEIVAIAFSTPVLKYAQQIEEVH